MKFLLGYKINFVFSGRNVPLVWGGDKNLVGGFTKGNFSRWGWCVSFQLVTGPTPPPPTTPLSPAVFIWVFADFQGKRNGEAISN